MSDKYILDGHKARRCNDLMKWAEWFETADCRVAETVVGDKRVSTVFIGLDHQFGDGPPLIFETMIFGLADDGEYQTRCETWEEAEEMHRVAVATLTGEGEGK
jgi:predicted LPLAT superfamily acyltransferase